MWSLFLAPFSAGVPKTFTHLASRTLLGRPVLDAWSPHVPAVLACAFRDVLLKRISYHAWTPYGVL